MESEQFDLTPELMEQIVFAMDNQKEKFIFRAKHCQIIPVESKRPSDGEYYELPVWEPSDGYRLMKRFVLSLKNPVYKEHLSSILHSGSGVFRKYKDALSERPDIERLWFWFKEKEMKKRVSLWYNDLRLQWGLEVLDIEPGEDYSPVLADFSLFQEDGTNLPLIKQCDLEAFRELYESYPADYIADVFSRCREDFEPEVSDGSFIYIAESPGREIAGFIWFTVEVLGKGTVLACLRQIYVKPEFRGLGLAAALKDRALSDEKIKSSDIVEIDVPKKADFIKNDLIQWGFVSSSSLLILNRKPSS